MPVALFEVEYQDPQNLLRAFEPTLDEVRAAAARLSTFYNDEHNQAMLTHEDDMSAEEVVEYYSESREDGDRLFLLEQNGVLVGDADFRNIDADSAEYAIMIGARNLQGRGLGRKFTTMLHASDQSRRQRQEGSREPVQVHLAPATGQRPPQEPRRRKREAGVQAALVGWHIVGRPCAARPYCQASRDHPPSSEACRQILGGNLVTLQPPQPSRPSPRRGRARGKRQAITPAFTLHSLEPAPKKDYPDLHRRPSPQNPAATNGHH